MPWLVGSCQCPEHHTVIPLVEGEGGGGGRERRGEREVTGKAEGAGRDGGVVKKSGKSQRHVQVVGGRGKRSRLV